MNFHGRIILAGVPHTEVTYLISMTMVDCMVVLNHQEQEMYEDWNERQSQNQNGLTGRSLWY